MTAQAPISLVMDPEEIETLHEAAVGLYASGRYAEARRAWEAVLANDATDARALEGVRMVRVLSGEWPADEPSKASMPSGSLADEMSRVRAFIADARYGDALLAAQRATESELGNAEARRLAARALELFEAAPYIDVELSRAKEAAASGRSAEVKAACQSILSLDPGHRAAAELLSRVAGASVASALPTGASPTPRPPSPQQTPPAERSPAPAPARKSAPPAPPAPAPRAQMTAPAADAFFDITDADLAPEETPVTPAPLGRPPVDPAPASSTSSGSPHEDAAFDFDVEIAPETDGPESVSGFKEAAGSAHHSLFEMPDEDVPTIKTTFSDLEAEIDESQGPTEGEVDFDPANGDEGQAGHREAALGGSPEAARDGAMDFGFDDEDFSLPEVPAVSVGAGASAEARIAALLDESRRALKNKRYSEAIEAAARAFAIDPDAQGAQQLIDDARTQQDEADREAEETLYAARDHLTTGSLDEAEAGFRTVLKTHPSHREALDGLDQISRRRNEKEIQGRPREAVPAAAVTETKAEPAEELWPIAETMVPKPASPRPDPDHSPAPRPAPIPMAAAPAAAKASSGLGRRIVILCAIVGVLVILAAAGAFAISAFLGRSKPVEKALVVPSKERKEIIKVDKATPAPVPGAKPRLDPAALAEGVPRTLPDARRLASEGKLEAARAVLADMVRSQPDNIAAVDALKSVQTRIVEREQTAESMEQIKHAYKQDRYEDALRMLYRLPADLQRGEIETFKANAWYNNGISYLLGGNCVEAVRSFDEALSLNPRDRSAQRLKAYARTYSDREKDSAFRAFVDGLEKRPIDAK